MFNPDGAVNIVDKRKETNKEKWANRYNFKLKIENNQIFGIASMKVRPESYPATDSSDSSMKQ